MRGDKKRNFGSVSDLNRGWKKSHVPDIRRTSIEPSSLVRGCIIWVLPRQLSYDPGIPDCAIKVNEAGSKLGESVGSRARARRERRVRSLEIEQNDWMSNTVSSLLAGPSVRNNIAQSGDSFRQTIGK